MSDETSEPEILVELEPFEDEDTGRHELGALQLEAQVAHLQARVRELEEQLKHERGRVVGLMSSLAAMVRQLRYWLEKIEALLARLRG